MKYKYKSLLNNGLLVLLIIMLFLTNPFFENKYRDAEKNVQIFKQEHYSKYDSLLREYDIQFEIIQFRKDSSENVIEQKYTIFRHELEMQKLKEIISKNDYDEQYDETFELEVAEILIVKDTFYESLTRLDRPEEIKVPRYLSKKVILFRNVDGLIGFIKWLLLVYVIIIISIKSFDKKNLNDRKIIPSSNRYKLAEPNRKNAINTDQEKRNLFEQKHRETLQSYANDNGNIVTVIDKDGKEHFVKSADYAETSDTMIAEWVQEMNPDTKQMEWNVIPLSRDKVTSGQVIEISLEEAVGAEMKGFDEWVQKQLQPKPGEQVILNGKPYTVAQDLGAEYILTDEKGKQFQFPKNAMPKMKYCSLNSYNKRTYSILRANNMYLKQSMKT